MVGLSLAVADSSCSTGLSKRRYCRGLHLCGATTNHDSGGAKLDLVTTEDDTAELVRLLMGSEDSSAWTFIELLEMRGATPASLYLGVITQAARRLGELWEDDRCDFTQVTISLGRLQQVVRALSPAFSWPLSAAQPMPIPYFCYLPLAINTRSGS